MQNLTFKVTARQRRGVGIWLGFVSALALGAIAVPLAITPIPRQSVEPLAITVGICVFIWAVTIPPTYAVFARGFTECTPAGIRARRLITTFQIPWPQVANIVVRSRTATTALQIITLSGLRYYLGAPITGSFMPDPEFTSKAGQIDAYWRSMRDQESRDPSWLCGWVPVRRLT